MTVVQLTNAETAPEIICIFCGEKANIVAHKGIDIVICSHCERVSNFNEYRRKLDNWLDEIRRN